MPSKSVENYLEALYNLHLEGEPIRTTDLAKALELSPASVTEMVQRLAGDGYLEYKRYHGVRMTPKGIAAATDVQRRRKLLMVFLVSVLGLSVGEALDEAHHLEHAVSGEVEERLCALLGNPTRSPLEDDEIPLCPRAPEACAECQRQALVPLSSIASGHRAVVRAVLDEDQGTKALSRIGLGVDTEVQVISSSGSIVTVSVKGASARLGFDVAQRVIVKRLD